jgi:peroxin-2
MKMMRMLLPKSYLVSSKGYDQLPTNQCAICHDNSSSENAGPIGQVQDFSVHNPYETNCGHRYCYYCIQSKLAVFGDEWPCLRCGDKVEHIEKHIEKVLDDDENENEKVIEESS